MNTDISSCWSFYADCVEHWAYKDNFLSVEECDAIIHYGKNKQPHTGTIAINNDEGISQQVNGLYRDSNVSWIYPEESTFWLYNKLSEEIILMNDKFFKFQLSGIDEFMQFTEYNSGGKYDAHIDKSLYGKVRKLTAVVQLSDENTYTHGDLVLLNYEPGEPLPRKRGSLILFPSYSTHKVVPVSSGVRYSLVCWVTGSPFK